MIKRIRKEVVLPKAQPLDERVKENHPAIASHWLWSNEEKYSRQLDLRPRGQFGGFHNHKIGKGKKILKDVINYLLEKRGKHNNDLNFLAKDYFDSVYKYYFKFEKRPFPNQLLPSMENDLRFDEMIEELERHDQFWKMDSMSYLEALDEVKEMMIKSNEKRAFMNFKITNNVRSVKESRPELFKPIYPETDKEYQMRIDVGELYYEE